MNIFTFMLAAVLGIQPIAAFAVTARPSAPDLILYHGKVFIAPGHYAHAVAIAGGRILSVGEDEQVLSSKADKTKIIDLNGRAVVPGFHDAHVHFLKGALAMDQLDLYGCTSVQEAQDKLRKYLKEKPNLLWVTGRGWDHTSFPHRRYPTRQDLDAVISDRPVVLTHVDEHLYWVNTAALKIAGITRSTPNPPNGEIQRDKRGEPTGIIQLHDSSFEVFRKIVPVPEPTHSEIKSALRKALAMAQESGVTSIQGLLDILPEEQLKAWRELDREGLVHLRYFIWSPIGDPAALTALKEEFKGLSTDKFRFGGLKAFLDGVISSRTAALLKPYTDDPSTVGEALYTQEKLNQAVENAQRQGYQAVLHAIGDRAMRTALDACEASRKALDLSRNPFEFPCKIEHIEVIQPEDIPRFKALGVVASMMPSHITYDLEQQNYNAERLGARVRYSFPWKSLEDAGALVVFGTDWPVMPLDPHMGLFAASTRLHLDGKPVGGWIPQEKMPLEHVLMHYTLDPARAIGRASELGSIEPGKLADLVVFGGDLLTTAGFDLLKIPVDMTIFNGEIVYERPAVKH